MRCSSSLAASGASFFSLLLIVLPGNEVYAETDDFGRSIEEVRVFGDRLVNQSAIGRNGLEAEEMSRSVQIFDAGLIDRANPVAIEDVLALSSNLSFLGDNDGRENAFVLRGFQNPPVLKDGFRVETFGGITDPELYNIEQVEVLKGPDSILYGEANPGGLINLRVKRPLEEDHGELALQAGTRPDISPRFDIGAGLGEGLRYRVVGLYQYDEGWRDYENANTRYFFAPSLAWKINKNTVLTVIAEYLDDDYQADFGTAINRQGELIAPAEQVNNHPQDTIARHNRSIGTDFHHDINTAWSIDARLRYFESGYDYSPLLLPFGLDESTLLYFRVPAQQSQDNEEIAAQFNVLGDIATGTFRHRISFGIDYREATTENATRFDPGTAFFLDWRNPDYSERPPVAEDIPFASGFYTNEDIESLGIFVQNHISLRENLLLSLGARYDDVERKPLPGSSSTAQRYDNTSLQAGLRFGFNENLSVFTNYSESFAPNFSLDKDNNALDPEGGDGVELGLKAQLFNARLSFTAALFDIRKTNVAITDITATPDDPNPFGVVAGGKQRSRGLEIDIQGAISERMSVTASVGISDTADELNLAPNAPANALRDEPIIGAAELTSALWLSFDVSKNLQIGGGYEYVGERQAARLDAEETDNGEDPDGFFDTTVELDDHLIFNAYLRFDHGAWLYQLNIQNFSDETYIDAAWGSLSRGVQAGEPRRAVASVRYHF